MSDKCALTHISKINQLCPTENIEAKVLFDLVLIPTFSFNFTATKSFNGKLRSSLFQSINKILNY